MTGSDGSRIKRIESLSAHRITSGQVVVDLQTAVKEILENSLDAGSTNVEVRFKDSGLESIEVIDNGTGINPEDYDSVALKHHTSKLITFEDLNTVATFGFRGEALSSLCALCEGVNITTATQDSAPVGTILEFNRLGAVTSKSAKVARQRGTTTTLTRLFTPLPVRRKDLERNIKREFGKALHLLTAYALIPCATQPGQNSGVRLAVTNQPSGKAKTTHIRTPGTTTRAAVSALWGPKTLDSLLDLDLTVEFETSKALLRRLKNIEDGTPNTSKTTKLQVKGLISRPNLGAGRASSDRQFFFVNSRPCNPSKVQKVINEVFREFNGNANGAQGQSGLPFVIADFILPKHTLDINVSPDKRTIFIHSEDELVVALKAALEREFEKERGKLNVNVPATIQSRLQTQCAEKTSTHTAEGSGQSAKEPLFLPEEALEEDQNDKTGSNTLVSSTENANLEGGRAQRKPTAASEGVQMGEEQQPVERSGAERDVEMVQVTPEARPQAVRDQVQADAMEDDESTPQLPLEILPRHRRRITSHVSSTSHSSSGSAIKFLSVPSPSKSTATGSFVYTSSSRNSHVIHSMGLKRGRDGGKEKEVGQMVLSTSGAAWSLKLGSQEKDAPPRKRVRTDDDGDPMEKGDKINEDISEIESGDDMTAGPVKVAQATTLGNATPKKVVPASPTKSLKPTTGANHSSSATAAPRVTQGKSLRDVRTRLAGYAMRGTQVQVEERESDEDAEEMRMGVDGDNQGDAPMQDNGTKNARQEAVHNSDRLLDGSTLEDAIDFLEGPSRQSPPISEIGEANDDNEADVDEEIRRTAASRVEVKVRCDLSSLTSAYARLAARATVHPTGQEQDVETIKALAEGAGTEADSEAAAAALERVIEKRDFETMDVVGQFNLGFVIVRRTKPVGADEPGSSLDDLFIVDQHAADEKYNFERLQRTTKIDSQRLVRPKALELTASDELLALENAEVLKQNGFEIALLDLSASTLQPQSRDQTPPGLAIHEEQTQDVEMNVGDEEESVYRKRVHLLAQPISKNTVFDMKDLEELLYLIQTGPKGEGEVVRCSKARAMFASRACRSSVMVGMSLKQGKMVEIVRHMGTMHQPWNCPHGRPTMRHLFDLTHFGKYPRKSREAVNWGLVSAL